MFRRKSSTGWFFGFKLHTLVDISGQIVAAILTPANWPERKVAKALVEPIEGAIVLAGLTGMFSSVAISAMIKEKQ